VNQKFTLSQSKPDRSHPENKSEKTALISTPEKRLSNLHLHQTKHHNLATKNRALRPVFPKNPEKIALQLQQTVRKI
jgi:hypothetical protein